MEDRTSSILSVQESITSYINNDFDCESLKLFHSKQSSDDSFKTILTVLENEESSNDTDDTNDEISDRHTHFCLKALKPSDFAIKLHEYLYPIPADPGLIPGFWSLHSNLSQYEDNGINKFKHLLSVLELQPIQQLSKTLLSNKIDLRYYGVNPKIVRAITEVSFKNTSLNILNLQDNWMSVDACFHLNELLVKNPNLTSLNLAGCRIGPRGAKRLQKGIGAASELQFLDVSRCNLGDEGLMHISTGICYSSKLQIVNFCNNKLHEGSGIPLQIMLTQSNSLVELNLSWNSLFSYEFWNSFIDGLSRNGSLLHLDLSWNSLGNECSTLLAKYLSRSTNLLEINLIGNSFEAKDAVQIAKALMTNTTLKVIHLANNPIQGSGSHAIIKAVTPQVSPHSHLRLLNLENIWISKDTFPLMIQIKKDRPVLRVILGGILGNYEVLEPDSRKIFLKRANFEAMKPKKKKKRKNFGQFVISLDDSIITRETFQKLVKRYKLKLRKSLVTAIMDAFTIGEDAIDIGALKTFYLREYPNTSPTLLESKKIYKKNKKKYK